MGEKMPNVTNLAGSDVRKGRYLMDYSKKYGEPCDVSEKARLHMAQVGSDKRDLQKPIRKGGTTMPEIGIKGHQEMIVTKEVTAKAMGSGVLDVFATPAMLALMEKTAFTSVADHLEEGCGTVGTKVEIEHVAASPVGMKVICDSELVAIEGRKLVFAVEAHDAQGLIGKGTHERFIVGNEKFMEKANQKLQ